MWQMIKTTWQGQTHSILFHSRLNPPFIFSNMYLRMCFIVALCPPPLWASLHLPPASCPSPPLSGSVSVPHFLLSLVPLLSLPSSRLPSFLSLSSSSSVCALDSLSFPLTHTLRQLPPLSTSTFTLTSSRSSRLLPFHHLLTHIISFITPSVVSLFPHASLLHLSHPFLLLTLNLAILHKRTRTHTHADWQPRTEHPLFHTGYQAVCLCGQASWHWAQLRKRPWSTATSSMFFPQMGALGARDSILLRWHRDAR